MIGYAINSQSCNSGPVPTIIGASRIATLLGDFDRSPAYAGLADALTPVSYTHLTLPTN